MDYQGLAEIDEDIAAERAEREAKQDALIVLMAEIDGHTRVISGLIDHKIEIVCDA